ncbi:MULTISPECIES: hypothetical protein [Leifsonia]|uniref:Uncharacterized protein n=1 Tax=Leifsonia soli TaxID=582665 RepID=A0A852SVU5_9MICO|nr:MULTISPECIES: hypothetical protein [Leifsonia]NYD72734.1 hypothetical protein [Leifsonia soli]SEA98563.1 hypothetical protein SAMN04515680_2476 [Leifsonia sp. 21MFCrub1.1]
MTTWPPVPVLLNQVAPHALWVLALLLLLAALGCIVATLRTPRRPLVYCATGLLAASLVVVLIPAQHAPFALRLLIGAAALALAVLGGWPVSQLVLALATRSTTEPSAHGGILVRAMTPEGETTREVLRGGTTIGLLERLAAAGTIMAGFPEGLAVLVAIKGVGRFTELEEAEARERFIIGTLTSIIWACACAAVFRIVAG